MKKFVVLPLLTVFVLCGCAKPKNITPVLNNISFTSNILYEDQEFLCDVSIIENKISCTVNSPEQLKGLAFNVDQNNLSAEFMGLSYEYDLNSLPHGSIIKILFKILNDVTELEVLSTEKNCEIKGSTDGYKYEFVFSPSGLPIILKFENLDLQIKFNNVVIN